MPSPAGSSVREQIDGAYRRMARFYRPAAPSDGLGNITVPLRELDLEAECNDYAAAWWAEEDTAGFRVGFPDMRDRPALVYVIEAARTICGMKPGTARKLLALALVELDGKEDRRDLRGRPPLSGGLPLTWVSCRRADLVTWGEDEIGGEQDVAVDWGTVAAYGTEAEATGGKDGGHA